MNNKILQANACFILTICASLTGYAASLTPPSTSLDTNGNPIASMKTIDEIEPRRAILSLPYAISNSGAYYLAKSLTGTPGNSGISVACSDVQIDLGGFSLIGTNGALSGIIVQGTNENINIKNGSIKEWPKHGIFAPNANDGSIKEIKVNRNGFCGMVFGDGAMIAECSAFGNGYKAPLPPAYSEPTMPDSDYDGMDDAFEQIILEHDDANSNLFNDVHDVLPNDDYDGDGAMNIDEFMQNTDPTDSTLANADGDTMDDGFEQMILAHDDANSNLFDTVWDVFGTDDYDGDGVNNENEFWSHTDPVNPNIFDSEPDGMVDQFEQLILAHDDANSNFFFDVYDVWPEDDYDMDGASNLSEFEAGTLPFDDTSFPTGNVSQSEYANYTNPPSGAMYEEFHDPMDEPNDDGIRSGGYAIIKECRSRGNRGSGIYAKYGSRIVDCTVAGNYVDGIHASDYATILDCTSARNKKDGITIGSKCRVVNNNCGQNGDFNMEMAAMPEGAGIRIMGNGNRIENNNVSGNALGIHVDDIFSYEYSGAAGMSGGGNLIIGNSSVDNWGAAFDLSAGDYMGGALQSTDVSDPSSTSNAMMDASNPFSNFTF